MKKCWCRRNLRVVSCDSHIFWVFFRWGITVQSFIIVGYIWQISGRGSFLIPMHCTSWKFFSSWKFSFYVVFIVKKAWTFLTNFWYCDQTCSKNIFIVQIVKSETSAHAQFTITCLYELLANTWQLYQLKTFIKYVPW